MPSPADVMNSFFQGTPVTVELPHGSVSGRVTAWTQQGIRMTGFVIDNQHEISLEEEARAAA